MKAAALLESSRQKELELERKAQVTDKVNSLKEELSSLEDKGEIVRRLEEFRVKIVAS